MHETLRDPGFEALRDAHVAALTGSLIDGVEHGPGGRLCLVARHPGPDPELRLRGAPARPVRLGGRGRPRAGPDPDLPGPGSRGGRRAPGPVRARRPLSGELDGGAAPGGTTRTGARGLRARRPGAGTGFRDGLRQRVERSRVRTHLRRTYLPALRAARGRPGLAPLHLVLRDAAGPAACASLYLRGDTAGLYNVSTGPTGSAAVWAAP
ncbi:GNAT family N-acetyltransferase [Methylobacterium oryzae CBMB20]